MFVHLDTLDATNLVQVVCLVSDDIDLDANANYDALLDFARESASVSEAFRTAEVDTTDRSNEGRVTITFARD